MAKNLIHTEMVSKTAIDATPTGGFLVVTSADALAKILAENHECVITVQIWSECPDKPSSTDTYDDKVDINHGCKSSMTSEPGKRPDH